MYTCHMPRMPNIGARKTTATQITVSGEYGSRLKDIVLLNMSIAID